MLMHLVQIFERWNRAAIAARSERDSRLRHAPGKGARLMIGKGAELTPGKGATLMIGKGAELTIGTGAENRDQAL